MGPYLFVNTAETVIVIVAIFAGKTAIVINYKDLGVNCTKCSIDDCASGYKDLGLSCTKCENRSCESGYKDFGLTCTKCNWSLKCDTYTKLKCDTYTKPLPQCDTYFKKSYSPA